MLSIHGKGGGYDYASRVDTIIAELMQAHDIEENENNHGYRAFLRTIETTLHLMRSKIPPQRRASDHEGGTE